MDPAIQRALRDQRALLRMGGPGQQSPDPSSEIGGGSPGKKLDEEARKGAAALAQLSSAAGMAFAAGAGAIASLGATAGAMSAWPTLKASITGVSIELGKGFLPYIDMASLALQDMEKWLETVSPGTKDFGARLVMTGTAAAGTAYAVMKLVGALRAVVASAGAARTAMAIGSLAPGIGLVAAAVSGVAAAWARTASTARAAAAAQSDAAAAGSGATGPTSRLTEDEKKALPERVRRDIEGKSDAEIRRRLAQEQKEAAEALERETDRAPERRAAAAADDARDAERVRGSMAARPDPGYSAGDRERMRASMMNPRGGVPVWSPADIDASRELASRGRREGRYRSDAEEEAAASRYREMFTRARAGMPADSVNARRAVEVPIAAAEARLRAAEAAARRTGADREPTRDYAGLPQARITDAPAMADAVQIKALQMQDKTAENQAKQLGELGSIRTEIVGMRTDIAALRTVFPVSYGRHGRADGRGDGD
jgi:hypothetical protein